MLKRLKVELENLEVIEFDDDGRQQCDDDDREDEEEDQTGPKPVDPPTDISGFRAARGSADGLLAVDALQVGQALHEARQVAIGWSFGILKVKKFF